jgi:hypothetical protein
MRVEIGAPRNMERSVPSVFIRGSLVLLLAQ